MKVCRSALVALVFLSALLFQSEKLIASPGSVPPGACLYALDPTASAAFQIAGAQSTYTACGVVVESTSSSGFEMEGAGTLYLENHAQVSVVGGADLTGQTYLFDTISNKDVSAVQTTSPGDPLASLAAPTTGTIVGKTPTYYDMNSKPANNTISPGVYCGGLKIGNTNGTTFKFNPGVYILAGGGLTLESEAQISGTGVTFYNTSSAGWGCASSYNYTPVTISGQVTATLSAPTSGTYNGILFFGNRTGCSTKGSCNDQINGGSTAILNGALYFASDEIMITGSNASGYMMLVADKIYINGNSNFGNNGNPFDGITVSLSPSTAMLSASQTQQFAATVANTANTAVTWSISPSGVGSISSSGLYTAPSSIAAQETATVTATSQTDTSKVGTATVTLTPPVVKTAPTITFTVPNQTYGVAPFAVSASSNSSGAISYSVVSGPATISGSTLTITGVGTVVLQASQAASGNYTAGTQTATFTVSAQAPTITFSVANKIYGVSPFTVAASSNSSGAITYSVVSGPATISGATVTVTGVGTVVLQASEAASGDFAAGTKTASFAVSAEAPTITFAVSNQTYGVAPFSVSVSSNSSGAITYSAVSGPAMISGSTVTVTGVGTVVLQASQAASGNYTSGTQTASFTVSAEAPTITFTVANQTYGVAPFSVSASSNSSGAITYSVVSGPATTSGSTVTITGVGTVMLQASQAASGDYTAGTQTATFTVSPEAPTITFTVSNQTYGVAPFSVSASSNSSGAITYTVVSGPATISGSTVTITGVGTVVLQASQVASGNYAAGTQTASFTVSAEAPTISFTVPNQTYGVAPFSVSASSNSSGAITYSVVSGPATISGSTVTIAGVGTVVLQASQAASGNYAAGAQSASFAVAAETQTITFTAPASPVTYGVSPIALSASSSSGLVVALSVVSGPGTVSGSTLTITGPGTVVVAANQAGNADFSAASQVTQSIVVNPTVSITVTPASGTLSAGQSLQFAATISNGGNTGVIWTISPAGLGTVDPIGLYTAPTSVLGVQTVRVIATSQANPTLSASATITLSPTPCSSNGYSYQRAITIDHTKVPNTDQVNFPFLFNTTDPLLATTANNGHVTSPSGYDIIFTSDPAGQNILNYEMEEYNPASGQMIAWVRIPDLSHTADTTIYLFYGNSAITTSQQNPTAVWDSNYVGVWHVANNGGSISLTDSTSNGNNATNNGAAATAGQIDGGMQTNGGTYATIGTPASLANLAQGNATFSAWVKAVSGTAGIIMGKDDGNGSRGWALSLNSSNNVDFVVVYGALDLAVVSSTPVGNGAWSYVTVTLAGNAQQNGQATVYVNGVPSGSGSGGRADTNDDSTQTAYLANATFGDQASAPLNGSEDEFRISKVIRSADWIATEYNNQGSPSTFYSFSPEENVVIPVAVSLSASESEQFAALSFGICGSPALTWSISPANAGTMSPSGLYTAPASIATQQTVTVTASSVTNAGETAQATITLVPTAAVTLTVMPSSATLYEGQSQQFTAVVTNVSNTAVTWSVGPANAGAISSSGLYTAPDNITAQQSLTITATSLADGTIVGSVTVTLMPPVSVSVTPQSAVLYSGQTQQFTADVTNAANTAVTWSVSPSGAGSISPNGLYTASSVSFPSSTFLPSSLALNGSAVVTTGGNVQLTDGGGYEASTAWYPYALPIRSFITDFIFQLIPPSSGTGADGITFAIQGVGPTALGGAGGCLGFCGISNSVAVKFDTYNNVGEGINSTGLFTDGAFPYVPAIDLTPTGINLQSSDPIHAHMVYDGTNLTMTLTDTVTNATATEVFPVDIPGNVDGNTAYVGFTGADGAGTSTQEILSWTYTSLAAQTVGVTATSVEDPTKTGNAEITLLPSVGVSATPASVVLYGGQTQRFTANVTNASNTAVTWAIAPATGAGTISSSGLYIAPAIVMTEQIVTITAASVASPATFATMTVTLVPQVSLTLTPSSVTLNAGQSQQFTVSGTSPGVTWTVLPAESTIVPTSSNVGTISSTGLYTAPASIPSEFSVVITATSTVNPTVFALATVNLMPPSSGGGGTIDIGISGLSAVILPNAITLTGTVTDSLGLTPTISWSKVSGPGTVTFTTPQQAATSVSFSDAGYYVLQLSASDSSGNSGSIQWPVVVNLDGANQGWIGSPLNGSTVSGVVPITVAAGITLQSGVLTYYPSNNPNSVVTLNSNTTGSGQIGTFDATVLSNGTYWIELQATTTSGETENNLVLVAVAGNYKPGRVTATVTDLVVPATGLPINIQRTYDSLNAATIGDFGYGWNLGINVNLTVGSDDSVTFTLGGQRRTFYLTPQYIGFLPYYDLAFTPEPGFFGSLTDSAPGCADGFDFLVPEGSLWFCVDGGQYNPPGYVYTDPNGTSYTISSAGNLQSIVDRSGNGLTITANGITSTTGLNVPFVRDGQNRITQITDPTGNIYSYTYDTHGNLATVTYPNTSQPSTYTYDANHLYLSGTDFRNNPLPTSTYYTAADTDPNGLPLNGRLASVQDALGNTTSYAYNLTTNTTTVTYPPDANGNVGTATMVYDSYGMLLSSTDPLGLTTTNTYDANHNLISVTDPLGNVNTYTYDSNGNKTSSTYPATPSSTNTTSYTQYNLYSEPSYTIDELGNVRNFNYDANFNPQSVADSIGTLASFTFNANQTLASGAIGFNIAVSPGNASQFTYDANGNLASRTDALGRTTSYTYNALGQKLSMTTPTPTAPTGGSASTTSYTYDQLGNLLQTAAPLSRTTSSTYDGNSNKISDTDARNNVTGYQYDALNRLIETDYPDGTKATKTYDFRNNVIRETDQNGNVTLHAYDLSGRQVSVTRGYGTSNASTTAYAYDNAGHKTSETDALGHSTAYTYDADGRLIAIAGVQGNFTYTYDNAGNRIAQTDANNNKTQYQYDARKRLTVTTYPDQTTTVNAYDGPGNLASVTDQADNVVQYAYDAGNQLTTVVQTASPNTSNNTNSYGYDPLGNLIALSDENLHTTQNSFDLFNEPVSKTLPDGTLTETRNYDPAGNLISLVHFNGVTTTYTYDALNRLLSRTTPGEAAVSFTYTATGKYLTSTAGDGTVNYSYDSLDRLVTKATPEGTLSYTYFPTGKVQTITSSNANGASVAYTYDGLNRLSTVVDNRLSGNNTTSYAYDPASNLATATYPNGVQGALTYDALNRITGVAASSPVEEVGGYAYQRGPIGNLTGATELNGRTINWSYDGIYRLTNEAVTSDPSKINGSVAYGLDPVGNRLSENSSFSGISSGSFGYSADDEVNTETYDQNGNATQIGTKTFTYDAENHLTSMSTTGTTVSIIYDAFGNRVSKTVNGVTTKYLVEDDVNPTGYPQVLDELTGGVVTRTYTYGLQRISEDQVANGAWTSSFYSYDGSGDVRQLTNTTGAVTDSYDYDAFGNDVYHTGSTPNNYLYRGEQYDSDLGLYYMRARYYNPLTGRFLSRDPENGITTDPKSLHKYLYASGDPVNIKDPTGRAGTMDVVLIDFDVALKNALAVTAIAVAAVCVLNEAAELIHGVSTGLGTPVESITFGFCSAKVKRKNQCSCEAKCTEHVIGMPNHGNTGIYYFGSGTANSCPAAQVLARKDAELTMPFGSHAQHCSFKCTE